MAKNGFHLSPDGPKPCSASKGRCPFGQHYGTVTEAAVVFQNNVEINKRNNARLELQKKALAYQGPDVLSIPFNDKILQKDGSGRMFDIYSRKHINEKGVFPGVIRVNNEFLLKGKSNEKDYMFRVKRIPKVDAAILKIKGEWTVEWWDSKGWEGRGDPAQNALTKAGRPPAEYNSFTFDLSSDVKTNASEEIFYEKLSNSFIDHSAFLGEDSINNTQSYDEIKDERNQKIRDFSFRFTDLIRAAENQSMGPHQASLHGLGYYEPYPARAQGGALKINQKYSNCGFSGRTMIALARDEEAVRNGPSASRKEASIKVWDDNTPDGSRWSIEHDPNIGWVIDFYDIERNGEGNRWKVEDGQDAQRRLYEWSENRWGADYANKQRNNEGGYVNELVNATNEAFLIINDQNRKIREEAEARYSQKDLFMEQPEQSNSKFSKIFDLFG